MPFSALAGLAFGIAIVSIGLYHVTIVAPRFRSIATVPRGDAPLVSSDATSLTQLRSEHAAQMRQTNERLDGVERAFARDLHRVGFVRFNSFDDVGSDQSYTFALLNGEGDGVVLTSIFSRSETRTFGKAVRKFIPQQGASNEEANAIAMARTGVAV